MTQLFGHPPRRSRPPKKRAPLGACDSHIHMLAAPGEAPLWEGRMEDPAEGWTYARFLAACGEQMADLGVSRTVVVQSLLYGTDNTVTARAVADISALKGLSAKGIGLVTDTATDAELDWLCEHDFVGVRLDFLRGGPLSWEGVRAMAPRLAERGLHVQMLLHTHRHMEALAAEIAAFPVPVVIDHMGWPDLPQGPHAPGFQALLRVLGTGNVWIKLSGLYRLCPAPYAEAEPFVKALLRTAPDRCLWGSDWPHIMLADAAQPESADLFDAVARVCPDSRVWEKMLVTNPEKLYGF